MNKSFKRVWNIITSVLVALVVILAVLLVGVRIAGIDVYTVLSGSMEPTYRTGALVYVKPCEADDISVGDPITFVLDDSLTVATHRVIEIDESGEYFRTKGDANEHADAAPVYYKNIIGKPVFSIPLLGYVANFIQHPPGLYLAIAAGAILLVLVFVPDMLKGKNGEK